MKRKVSRACGERASAQLPERSEARAATVGLPADGAASTGGGQPGARRSGQVQPDPRGQWRRPTALAGRRD